MCIRDRFKHGKDAFAWEVLHENVPLEMLDNLESQHIRLWRCLSNGYNLLSGGQTNKEHSDETKKRISESLKGKMAGDKNPMYGKKAPWTSERNKRQTGENNPNFGKGLHGENHPNWGKKASSETRKKISVSRRGKPPWNKGKRRSKKTSSLQLDLFS